MEMNLRPARLCTLAGLLFATPAAALNATTLDAAIQKEEAALHGRMGATVLDLGTGASWRYRGDERFPLNSTHKAFACAALLAKVDSKSLDLDQPAPGGTEALQPYSPILEKLPTPRKLSLRTACGASVSYSDNTAANLVIDAVGGPSAVTSFMRSLGDDATRLDRKETEMSEAAPGDLRDTTTPDAIAGSLRKILLGDALSAASRDTLTLWMLSDQVAGALLRASLPPDWKIADKTGAGGYGSRGVVAVIWPPARRPLVVAIYIAESDASLDARNKAIARFGAALIEAAGQQ